MTKSSPQTSKSQKSPSLQPGKEKERAEGESASAGFYFFIGVLLLSLIMMLGTLVF